MRGRELVGISQQFCNLIAAAVSAVEASSDLQEWVAMSIAQMKRG